MKPFVLMTVHRRYFELIANLKRYHALKSEFREKPSLVIVWAEPQEQDQWIFDTLLENECGIDFLLKRALLPDDDHTQTTYPESHNIRLGLDFIKNQSYGTDDTYCLMQCHDLFLTKGTYAAIDEWMQKGYDATFFYKKINGCHCYYTNLFAITISEIFWPPVSDRENFHILEYQWFNKICDNLYSYLELYGCLPEFKVFNQFDDMLFHSHTYEDIVEWLQQNKLT